MSEVVETPPDDPNVVPPTEPAEPTEPDGPVGEPGEPDDGDPDDAARYDGGEIPTA